ncbi:MAG: CDP-glycerol glycerophosphotransferase family protein [Chloroflexi bacterium]|nr:CDP-glycerol glycerophosphotransferase family protein [Chloroflexota bacterium]
MERLTSPRPPERPVLFVAREPDETLRTFLPVIDRLQADYETPCSVLFHHAPGDWARAALAERGVPLYEVALPGQTLPAGLGRLPGAATVDEIARLSRARALAQRMLREIGPSAVVVIQDTLLLERFLVREANAAGLPTLVVQWAFSYPQEMYDRLRKIQYAPATPQRERSPLRQRIGPLTRTVYQSILGALGLRFTLVESYGGGEAEQFAVMGSAFRDQFVAQGVRKREIVVTGHPTHDAVYRRAQTADAAARLAIRQQYGMPLTETVALYATQPVLWRKVISHETLEANVRAMAEAIQTIDGCTLVLKLHPREHAEDYAFCQTLDPPVTVLTQAEMPDLIAACDLFISSSSSTVLLAMLLDRPIVTVNFDEVPHFDQFEPIGGTVHVRTHGAFADAVWSLLTDSVARDRLRRKREEVVERYTRFDGKAAARIAAVIAGSLGLPLRDTVGAATGAHP